MSGYDPNKSKISQTRMGEFLLSDIDEEITTIPGIGESSKALLKEVDIETSYQLFGQFLMLKASGSTTQEHCDAFWFWLKDVGINSYRSGIIETIAEKLETSMPGIYVRNELLNSKK